MKKAKILVMLGDCTGIGPEVTAKAMSDPDVRSTADFVLVGDRRVWEQACRIAAVEIPTATYPEDALEQAFSHAGSELPMIDSGNIFLPIGSMGRITPEAGKAMGDDLRYALAQAKAGKANGIVYAPLNKAAMNQGGYHFRDELEFFIDELEFTGHAGEINTIGTLWAARIASHIPISMVPQMCTFERVLSTIRLTDKTLREAGYSAPRIGMNALNPHAGDNGLCGDEEIRVITPAIEEARREGIDVTGPYPGDTVFLHAQNGELDAIIGTYHDQVQVGIKLLGFHKGVTINAGLPVVLITPAHGTAFDIAGKGKANPGPMKTAVTLCAKMAQNRLRD